MTNATIEKFGYPETSVAEHDHWLVLVRPAQVTLGSLVLAAKTDATSLSALPDAAFGEFGAVVRRIEAALAAFCRPERINYLTLMMVDPHVHTHVIPRYDGRREADGLAIADQGWPALPDLRSAVQLSGPQVAMLRDRLRVHFGGNSI